MEKVILKRIIEGDNLAFEELYNEYADYALRVALAVTRSKMNAADAVQETFIRIYKSINKFELDKPFKPWFYKILINECNRILNKDSKMEFVDDFTETGLQGASNDDYSFVDYEDLYRAIEGLEYNNRIVIVLKYLNGFKESEIADILGVNINTVKSRLFKGREKLKKLIVKFEGGCDSYEKYGG